MEDYVAYLSKEITDKDNLKRIREEAKQYYETHSLEESYEMIFKLYQSEYFQVQEVGVFLCGYVAFYKPELLEFLESTVSQHESWKVQEILAMAFDTYCSLIGYKTALPIIKKWIINPQPNVRRAVSEGLRIWTSRDYFRENPSIAIELLSSRKEDPSEYVRKSIGNALKDISKKYPELIRNEIENWDCSSKEVAQVYKLASKFL